MASIYERYPLLNQFFEERRSEMVEDVIGPLPARLHRLQEQAFAMIDKDATGTHAEKQAAMICAALIIEPASMYYDITRLILNYGEEMEYAVESLIGARPGEPLPVIVALARAASGTLLMKEMSRTIAAGEADHITTEQLRGAVNAAFAQDETSFANLGDSNVAKMFLSMKNALNMQLDERAAAENPAPPKKGKGRSFDI